jgi:hypothetical protein
MAKISGWEKFRKAVTGSYSEKLTLALAQEAAEVRRAQLAVDKSRIETKKTSAGTGKVASGDKKKPAAPKKPAAKKPVAKKPAAAKKKASK